MFTIKSTVRLTDTDAAGILFYGNYFRLAHEVYESFMDEIDFPLSYVLRHADVMLLIAHAESEYKTSLKLGDKYIVNLRVEKIGGTSFILNYEFTGDSDGIKATVRTVHVAVDKQSNKPVALPDNLREKLQKYV